MSHRARTSCSPSLLPFWATYMGYMPRSVCKTCGTLSRKTSGEPCLTSLGRQVICRAALHPLSQDDLGACSGCQGSGLIGSSRCPSCNGFGVEYLVPDS